MTLHSASLMNAEAFYFLVNSTVSSLVYQLFFRSSPPSLFFQEKVQLYIQPFICLIVMYVLFSSAGGLL